MGIHNCSIVPGEYMKMTTNNDMIQAPWGMELRCSQDDRTLSKKGRGVKILELILELKGNQEGRQIKLLDFWI